MYAPVNTLDTNSNFYKSTGNLLYLSSVESVKLGVGKKSPSLKCPALISDVYVCGDIKMIKTIKMLLGRRVLTRATSHPLEYLAAK